LCSPGQNALLIKRKASTVATVSPPLTTTVSVSASSVSLSAAAKVFSMNSGFWVERRRRHAYPAHANKMVRNINWQKLDSKQSGLRTNRAARTFDDFTDGLGMRWGTVDDFTDGRHIGT
jgi:hypothetical protein